MKVLDSVCREDIEEFVEKRVEPAQQFKTDGLQSHHVLHSMGHKYQAIVCSGPAACIERPIVHRTISLLKHFLMGTYFGVSPKYLPGYLNEFCFRFNRRDSSIPIWVSLLRACLFANPFHIAELCM